MKTDTAYLDGIYAIIEASGQGLDEPGFAQRVLQICCQTLPADAAALCTVQAGGDQVSWMGWCGLSPEGLAQVARERLQLDERFREQLVFHGQQAAALDSLESLGSFPGQMLAGEKLTRAAQAAAGQPGGPGCVLLAFRRSAQPFKPHELRFLAAAAGLANRTLISLQACDDLALLCRFDPITGLLHHQFFNELAEREFERARRSGTPLSLVLLEIQNFATINQRCGRLRSEQLLAAVGESLREALRSVDLISRSDGSQFSVLLTACSEREALRVVARVQERMGMMPAVDEKGVEQCQVTLRFGATTLDLLNDENFAALTARASAALADG